MSPTTPNMHEARARALKADKLFRAALSMGIKATQAEEFSAYQRSLVAGIAKTNEPSDATWLHVCALLRGVESIEAKAKHADCDAYCQGDGDPFCKHNQLDVEGGVRAYLDAVDKGGRS